MTLPCMNSAFELNEGIEAYRRYRDIIKLGGYNGHCYNNCAALKIYLR